MIERRETITVLLRDKQPERFGELTSSLRSAGFRVVTSRDLIGTEETRGLTPHVVIQVAGISPAACATMNREVRRNWPYCETVALAPENSELSFESTQHGLFACLPVGAPIDHLLWAVQRAGERAELRRELTALRESVVMNYGFDNFVGVSNVIVRARETARKIAPTDIPILLTGRSGTGKRHLATIIHHHSHRRRAPFVTVDLRAVPSGQHVGLLFGDLSDGTTLRPGLLERADGGTVYLDHVDAMSVDAQERVYAFLQNHTIASAGIGRPIRLDIRVISSSHVLPSMPAGSKIRSDLLNALNVICIDLPPLDGRDEDIDVLTDHFLHRLTAAAERAGLQISSEARARLSAHSWPGNVRELESTLRRAIALCRERHIDADDIVFLNDPAAPVEPDQHRNKTTLTIKGGLLDNTQRTLIIKALDANNWNYSRTAEDLGIGRTTLWRKIRKYDLKRETTDA